MTTTITFTGTVADLRSFDKATKLNLEIDENREYPARADVWVDNHTASSIGRGDEVEVTCSRMPYADKPWQGRDGEWKAGRVTYNADSVKLLGGLEKRVEQATGGTVTDTFDDIPF